MNGNDIGKMIADAVKNVPDSCNVMRGGNLGMAFIAVAISEHASAIRDLSNTLKIINTPSNPPNLNHNTEI